MARAPKVTDFKLSVEGIGDFIFAKRTLEDEIVCHREFIRLTDNQPVIGDMRVFSAALADLKILTVESPDGWNPADSDPFDPDSYDRLIKVWGALRDKEGTFRRIPKGGQAGGKGADGELRTVVPQEVQPAPE